MHMGREQDTKVPQSTIPLFGICMFSNLKPHTASEVAKLTRHTRNKLRDHDHNNTQITGQLHWTSYSNVKPTVFCCVKPFE